MLRSNPAALTIPFLKDQGVREINKDTQFNLTNTYNKKKLFQLHKCIKSSTLITIIYHQKDTCFYILVHSIMY